MSGSDPGAGWVAPGRSLPAYSDPAGSGVQLGWDGHGWTGPALWPPSPEVPAPPPGRLVAWLASPAALPLLAAVAAVAAAGWVVAAAVVAAIAVAGHPITAAVAALSASAFVLPALDCVTAIASLALLTIGRPAAPARPMRAVRKTVRSARNATVGRPAAMPVLRRSMRHLGSSIPFGSLPRPVGLAFAVTLWSSALVFAWLMAWTVPRGGFSLPDAGTTASGQQLAAAAWMMHLIIWCGVACRRLSRNRAAASMWS